MICKNSFLKFQTLLIGPKCLIQRFSTSIAQLLRDFCMDIREVRYSLTIMPNTGSLYTYQSLDSRYMAIFTEKKHMVKGLLSIRKLVEDLIIP